MQTLLIKIASIIIAPVIFLGGLISPVQAPMTPVSTPAPTVQEAPTQNVGAALPQATGVFETSLASPITSTATSMTLTANSVRGGGAVSGYTCFTLDEGSAQAEVICGTVSSTAVSSLTRGVSYADGITSVTANKFSHRRGANVKITDFPLVQILKAQNNGDATFPNPIKYETGIGPSASSDLADKEYVLSVVSGGAVSFEKVVISGTAGETVAAGNLLYLKSSDGRWWLTDADTASTVENVKLGIAQGAGTAGVAITGGVLISGTDSNQTGLSANTIYYASNSAGGISSSVGTKEVTIGIAISTTSIVFAPRYNQQITEDEQDAMAGTSGTPSSSNPYSTKATTDTLNTGKAAVTDVQTFTSSGTYTKPAGTPIKILIQAWGGGGSGGRWAGNGAAGGGGGGYVEKLFEASTVGATETVTIGDGGAAKGSDGAGNVGGNTTIGSLLTAYGGGGGGYNTGGGGGGGGGALSVGAVGNDSVGGNGGSPTSGAGGSVGTGGHSSFGGGGGGDPTGGDSGYGGAGGGGTGGGVGGSSYFGGGGGAGNSGTAGTSVIGGAGGGALTVGVVPGGGGGGSTTTSGAGGKGKVIITTFY
jgi:hypothetical protein